MGARHCTRLGTQRDGTSSSLSNPLADPNARHDGQSLLAMLKVRCSLSQPDRAYQGFQRRRAGEIEP